MIILLLLLPFPKWNRITVESLLPKKETPSLAVSYCLLRQMHYLTLTTKGPSFTSWESKRRQPFGKLSVNWTEHSAPDWQLNRPFHTPEIWESSRHLCTIFSSSPLNKWKFWDPSWWVSCDGYIDPPFSLPKEALHFHLHGDARLMEWEKQRPGSPHLLEALLSFHRWIWTPYRLSSQFTESSVSETERKSRLSLAPEC